MWFWFSEPSPRQRRRGPMLVDSWPTREATDERFAGLALDDSRPHKTVLIPL